MKRPCVRTHSHRHKCSRTFLKTKKHYKTVTRCDIIFILQKLCLCKKNDKYEVCAVRILYWYDEDDRGANLLGWVCQEDLGHWSLPQANLIPVLEQNQAKLYYTSFWDKFGMNINYFGMHPKTKKKVWDGSQVKAFPNPDHPPLEIFLTYPSFRTKLKTCVYLKSSFNQSGCGESESSFRCTL